MMTEHLAANYHAAVANAEGRVLQESMELMGFSWPASRLQDPCWIGLFVGILGKNLTMVVCEGG